MQYSVFSTCTKNSFIRSVILAFFLFQLAIPALSQAQTAEARAGFAQSAIWMSRARVVAGESVNIFTVLYNSSDNSISGDVIFSVDSASVGTKNFTLGAGETQIVSAPWIAKAGNHTASAHIENTTGLSAGTSVLNQTTGTITVSVEAPPAPSPAAQVLNTVASLVQAGVASTAPAIASAASSLYGATESLRTQAKTALEKQLAKGAGTADAKQVKAGVAQNQSIGTAASTTDADEEPSVISKALRYMAAAGLVVVSSRTLFYISLALILLLLIQILRVALRERRRGRRYHEIET